MSYNKNENSGAVSGARNPFGEKAKKHAEMQYEKYRKDAHDVSRIAKNTGYTEKEIRGIKNYLFLDAHPWMNGARFDPDFMIAESWKRLSSNNPVDIKPHDLTLLKHELMEQDLIAQGMDQNQAHIETSKIYNYGKEAAWFYGQIKKYKKE